MLAVTFFSPTAASDHITVKRRLWFLNKLQRAVHARRSKDEVVVTAGLPGRHSTFRLQNIGK